MVTMADIAEKVGVAKSTVSNALSGKRYVAEELKSKILAVCRELNFNPDFFASTLINKKTNIVGLFLEQRSHEKYQPFYNTLLQSMLIKLSEYNYNLLVYYNASNEKIMSYIQHGKSPVDGAVILSPEISDVRVREIYKNMIPCVIIGRANGNGAALSTVDTDNCNVAKTLTAKLIQRGRRRIVLLNSRREMTLTEDRLKGYTEAVREAGLTAEKRLLFNSEDCIQEDGRRFMEELYAAEISFDAVLTANDSLALGVYDALKQRGAAVGENVSVAALGGELYTGDALTPPLTYAHQNYLKIGEVATEVLYRRLSGKNAECENIVIPSDIIYTTSI